MPLTEQEEFELLSLEREKAMGSMQQPQDIGVATMEEPTTPAQLPLEQQPSFMPKSEQVETKITERPNLANQFAQELATNYSNIAQGKQVLQPYQDPRMLAKLMGAVNQRVEAGVANMALAAQQGDPSKIMGDMVKGITGERLGEFGDVYRKVGMPEYIAVPLGMLNMAAVYGGGEKLSKEAGKLAGKIIPKIKPTIFNDKVVNNIGEEIANKVVAKKAQSTALYEEIYSPFKEKMVDGDDFAKALNSIPKKMRRDMVDKYAMRVLDKNGKPITTVENLGSMLKELGDIIKKPDALQSYKTNSIEAIKAFNAVKKMRLKQLPLEAVEQIKLVDKTYGPILEQGNIVLKKIKPKEGGPVNTKALYEIFNNPKDAGTREFLRNLKNIGIDVAPQLEQTMKWVKRQRFKQNIPLIGKEATITGILGKLLLKK